jgi:hypothetical protein
MRDLDHPVFVDAENTNSWCARKVTLQRSLPLDVLMVPSSALAVAADSERLLCGGFSLGETIHFGSLEFIVNRFGGLSLSPIGDGSDAIIMGSIRSGMPSLLQATVPTMGHDRGLHRGVPHGFERRRKDRPPLS